ncbi:sensor histidine kinase [Sporomusa acidovorans]|uniref:histidine kinase n=1 Tax=Sporomusa acidovorans (strain ATCC 49682 / DSM 3132 / Mol) TaxID=1123286 RepID=A0ABZ3J553_SPOA4|nr:sensor histidine kinase [Sporomusa acidovorans]OZC16398.1 sensor histidine kinase YpdA [Sporomusa acidovorans DSM 3132]SDE99817.1 two-component system, LytT family, sensor histidine kinase LytS [Sporomusa acidovorans]
MSEQLLIELIERMSVAATLAFVLSQTNIFRRLINRRNTPKDAVLLTIFFGLIGITGTYAGIPVNDAIANSRVVGVMAAGLIGGPFMGLSAGLIAGGHRYLLGGFTAFSCALANVCEGLLAGIIQKRYPGRPIPWWLALLAGVLGETMQMGIILLTARPYYMAAELVGEIAVPMIVANSLGLAVFMLMIKTAMVSQERIGAEQSHKALDIANKTLPYLRRGLNAESAHATAHIILATAGYDAVAITDTERILAFIGAESSHHAPPANITLTTATRQVLATGHMQLAQDKTGIGCSHTGCQLLSAIIVPLKCADRVIGALKLYYTRKNAIGQSDLVFATGLAHLFSTQLELTEIDHQSKMAAKARLKALHAQINPHFLFNTLNTIISLVRTKPDLARDLLIKLSAIFRYTLHKTGQNITIDEELAQVRAYLSIEQARHGEKLVIKETIDPGLGHYRIPSLTIQPLVENAIKHGLQPKPAGGTLTLKVTDCGQAIEINIIDDGIGMDLEAHNPLEHPSGESIGLINVHERLYGQYGASYGLTLASQPNQGTTITLRFPKILTDEVDDCA